MAKVCMVFVTAPNEEVAAMLARAVVDEGHAACGNLIPRVRSIYRWQGEVHDEEETLTVFKTTEAAADGLRIRIVALHPYECPEVVIVGTDGGHAPYLSWVADSVTKKS